MTKTNTTRYVLTPVEMQAILTEHFRKLGETKKYSSHGYDSYQANMTIVFTEEVKNASIV